jgi:FlgD Ig-like domain/Receptor L domain
MKTPIFIILFFTLHSFFARGQCTGPVTLTTQAEVDAFPISHPCTEIIGDLSVSGSSDIVNLDSLYRLTKIDGILTIGDNTQLTNLDGLSALNTLGISQNGFTSIVITGNPALTDIKGLKSLSSLPGTLQIENNTSLPNLDGLESLTQIGSIAMRIVSLIINGNTALTNLDGLSSLHSVGGYYLGLVDIENNPSLTHVNGLSSLETITGGINAGLTFINNASLTNLDGLSSFARFTAAQGIIRIIDNITLTQGCTLYTVLNSSNIPGSFVTVVISGNGAGFTSEEILAGGPCLGPIVGVQPSNLLITGTTTHSMNVSFTGASPAPQGYITLMRAFGSPYPDDKPVDGTVYQVGNVIGASTIVVGVGSQLSFSVTSLIPNTLYYLNVFSYYPGYDYVNINPLAGSQQTENETITLPPDPVVQPSDLLFSDVTSAEMTISFTAPVQTPTGYITLMKAFSSPFPQDVPVDGVTYRVGGIIGNSTIVVGLGTSTSLNIQYLMPGLEYYFNVYAYHVPAVGGPDYLEAVPLEGSQRTTLTNSSLASQSAPFPNPFIDEITIPFSIEANDTFVQVDIYNAMGSKVADVVSQNFDQGFHEVKWNRADSQGNKVTQGLYRYSIKMSGSNQRMRGTLVAK